MKMVEYRTDFWFWLIVSLMWTAFNFFFFSLIMNVSQTIAGWSHAEMYVLLSVFTMLDAFTWSIMAQNMWSYTDDIFQGSLSTLMVKPVDLQFVTMWRETSFNNLPRFFIGLVMLFVSLDWAGIQPTWQTLTYFALLVISGFILVYSAWYINCTLAFWTEKLDNINEIVPGLRRVWQVPRSVYSGLSSILLTLVIPLGLVTSIPSEIILGKDSGWLSWYLLIASLASLIISRWFLKISVKKYTSVGG
jgi:ABC-2 type transport system permease protein